MYTHSQYICCMNKGSFLLLKHGMLVSLLYRYMRKRLHKMVLSDLVSGVVAVNATGHADSLFISDFIIVILDICRSVLQVFFFSYQCNNLLQV